MKILRFAAKLSGFALMLASSRPALAQQAPPARSVALDVASLRRQLTAPPPANARLGPPGTYRLALPTLRGSRQFVLTESHVLPAADAAARQRLRTYVGYEEGAPTHLLALVLTPSGLTAQLAAGAESAGLRPAPGGGAGASYLLTPTPPESASCGVREPTPLRPGPQPVPRPLGTSAATTLPAPFSYGTQQRRIRYAVLVTSAFYTKNGNNDSDVEKAVVTALNVMTALYQKELALSFELVKPTGGSYYFSAVARPALPGNSTTLGYQNLTDVKRIIKERFVLSSYDLGHCYNEPDGGVAGVGVLCSETDKQAGWSGVPAEGLRGILAHEMGHQLGADHVQNGDCFAAPGSNVEPGSGSTIMSYRDVCAPENLLDVSDQDYYLFNARSLDQMRTRLNANQCLATPVANTNRPPTVSAGPDYVIPRNTPFTLTASGRDPDGDLLTYTWDQFDYTANIGALGTVAGKLGLAAVDDPDAPLFRSRQPRLAPSRTFPDLRYVLNNGNRPDDLVGEALPNVGRDLNFVVTARDQRAGGGTFSTDNVKLTVAPGTGPFAVASQNAADSTVLWLTGQPATVKWLVGNTDKAPIGVAQVRITLSIDGGQTFGTVLAAAAPNTGVATVTVPAVTSTQARLRVEAVGNVFFDINNVDFTIGACAPVVTQILPSESLTAPAGDAALNLSQLPFSPTELTGANQLAGTITQDAIFSNLSIYQPDQGCVTYSNQTYCDVYDFVPSVTGVYTIGASQVRRVYPAGGFQPDRPCQDMLKPVRGNDFQLTGGQPYTLVVSDFAAPGDLGGSYRVSFTTQTGGRVYAPLQRAGYDYQYAVVNAATGQVVQLAPTADLRALPGGTYDVYGLAFQRGFNLAGVRNASLGNLQAALAGAAPCGRLSANARRVTITSSPLPVVLTAFSARRATAGNELSWQTASATGVAYFQAQRSPDGEQFTTIGRVAARNGAGAQQYALHDAPAPAALTYYRLLVQDADGHQAYSPVVAVPPGAAAPASLAVAAYPNPVPAGGALQLQLQLPLAQLVRLTLLDALGRPVLRREAALPAGTTLLALPEAGQLHGLFVLVAEGADGQRQQRRLVLE